MQRARSLPIYLTSKRQLCLTTFFAKTQRVRRTCVIRVFVVHFTSAPPTFIHTSTINYPKTARHIDRFIYRCRRRANRKRGCRGRGRKPICEQLPPISDERSGYGYAVPAFSVRHVQSK